VSRYRSYSQLDDAPQENGDSNFVGVNQYDAPENLQPGQAQEATNIDFTKGDAETRGGWVCLPELGATPFGTAWTAQTSAADNNYTSIAYGNGTYVAVANTGTGNRVMTSPDGRTWTARTSAADLAWNSVTFGNGLFVAVAATNDANPIMTSPTGITWTSRAASLAGGILESVAYGDGYFVAVGSGGAGTLKSTDGITWSAVLGGIDVVGARITFGNGRFVTVAPTTPYAWHTTVDLSFSFTSATTTVARTWNSVAYGNDLYVAVASSGTGTRVMTSPDGDVWTARTSAADNDWRGVAFGSGQFVAVSETGSATRVMASTDGTTWVTRATSTDNDWQAVVFGGTAFVAVSDTGTGTRAMRQSTAAVFASGTYSDPNATEDLWTVLVGASAAGFYAFGKTSHTIDYPAGVTITLQSTVVQANNILFIFPGEGQTPIQWSGNWSEDFVTVPASTLGVGFSSVPQSNQATYYQNRLWVVNGKDAIAASDVLDFEEYDALAADFNLNTGSADYVVRTIPFGDNSLVVFKHNSSILLQNVEGSLVDVVSTEISRNLGISGINAVTAVGLDLVYVSDRNITSIRLNLQNKLQNVTEPLSRNINPILRRVNWTYGYKISMGYWNNLLFVALPLDQATTCSTVVVFNFVTQQWYGEWNFDASINMAVQGFVVANYLGQLRLHAITEDGRIFVTDNGQNDISGTTVAEITTSLTTRAYSIGTGIHAPRRVYMDLSTNRPNFSVTAYSDGANESTVELASQTFSRADSWLWNDTAYDVTNANNDYNRAYRQDYSTGPDSVQCGASGLQPEMTQDLRFPLITRRHGRLSWFKVENSQGFFRLNTLGIDASESDRSNRVTV